ncbi:MAG: TAXI family TRAP transporter solute-binding subunit [Pseudonocardia sp.]|nr:TAXI family TRAP transporter solute-binding subunit [Pseudonocardia sp.]
MPEPRALSRRTVLRAAGGLGLLAGLGGTAGCGAPFADRRLPIAAGVAQGVYSRLATTLAEIWREDLHLHAAPEVLATFGSPDNLGRLTAGTAEVAFSQVDTAAELMDTGPADGPRALRGLARIYDDVLHVVIRRDASYRRLADLRGARVSVGPRTSGYRVIAQRVLAAAGLDAERDIVASELGLQDACDALRAGAVDAFFWSGGLPTTGIATLAQELPIRLLDLADDLKTVRERFPVYSSGTVPVSTYDIGEAVSTLLTRNILLVPASMEDDLAEQLVRSLFQEQQRLAEAGPAAITIDARTAIGTQPVPLHPGAERFYRESKDA